MSRASVLLLLQLLALLPVSAHAIELLRTVHGLGYDSYMRAEATASRHDYNGDGQTDFPITTDAQHYSIEDLAGTTIATFDVPISSIFGFVPGTWWALVIGFADCDPGQGKEIVLRCTWQSDYESDWAIAVYSLSSNSILQVIPKGEIVMGPMDMNGDGWEELMFCVNNSPVFQIWGHIEGGTSDVDGGRRPSNFSKAALSSYPNPAIGDMRLQFQIPSDGLVHCSVYDIQGRRVRDMGMISLSAGSHETSWDCRDDAGQHVPSGMYFLRLQTVAGVISEKALVIR